MSRVIITDTPPKFSLLGQTQTNAEAIRQFATEYGNTINRRVVWDNDLAVLPTIAGSVCYDSFDNKADRTNTQYIDQSILRNEHFSVLEHVTFNFGVSHLNRLVLMELSRHRVGTAFSFRSTRYTDSWVEYITPPTIRGTNGEANWRIEALYNFEYYEHEVQRLKREHPLLTRKERIEAARSVLWSTIGTQGVFSVNARELRHIVLLRTAKGADASFRETAYAMWDAVAHTHESLFADLVEPEDRTEGITVRTR